MDKAEILKTITDFWNDRYAQSGYIYGDEPNLFFKHVISSLQPGSVFLPWPAAWRGAARAKSGRQ